MNKQYKNDNFDTLSPTERARTVSVVRLIKHFRGLERSGLLSREETGSYIGAVKILEAQCKGEFKERVAPPVTPVVPQASTEAPVVHAA